MTPCLPLNLASLMPCSGWVGTKAASARRQERRVSFSRKQGVLEGLEDPHMAEVIQECVVALSSAGWDPRQLRGSPVCTGAPGILQAPTGTWQRPRAPQAFLGRTGLPHGLLSTCVQACLVLAP